MISGNIAHCRIEICVVTDKVLFDPYWCTVEWEYGQTSYSEDWCLGPLAFWANRLTGCFPFLILPVPVDLSASVNAWDHPRLCVLLLTFTCAWGNFNCCLLVLLLLVHLSGGIGCMYWRSGSWGVVLVLSLTASWSAVPDASGSEVRVPCCSVCRQCRSRCQPTGWTSMLRVK